MRAAAFTWKSVGRRRSKLGTQGLVHLKFSKVPAIPAPHLRLRVAATWTVKVHPCLLSCVGSGPSWAVWPTMAKRKISDEDLDEEMLHSASEAEKDLPEEEEERPRKQQRRSRKGRSQKAEESDDDEDTAENGVFKMEAGAIERVDLENFMCHKNLTVKFDRVKNVNFIVGPNGSTLSCFPSLLIHPSCALLLSYPLGLAPSDNHIVSKAARAPFLWV